MKLNRTLVFSLCIVMAVAMALGGSVAFLSADDGDVNVMVVGNVQIEQNEYQRVDQTTANSELEEFAQGKNLLPYVEKEGTLKIGQEVDGWNIQIRDESVIRNYVDKIVNVTNGCIGTAYPIPIPPPTTAGSGARMKPTNGPATRIPGMPTTACRSMAKNMTSM